MPTEGIVSPNSVNPGDLVEILSRDGSIKGFGVVTFSLMGGMFDYLDVSGKVLKGYINEVSFTIRGHFPEKASKFYEPSTIVPQLRSLLTEASSRASAVVPILTVVHAQLALPDRPRAVDFEDVCQKGLKVGLSAKNSSSASRKLTIYLAMAYHSLYFVRTQRSPFVLVSSKAMSAVNKVMNALTKIELDYGSAQLVEGKSGGVAKTLKTFIDHWALWNDSRIAGAAQAILEVCSGGVRKLDSPRAMSSALSRLPNTSLFPWLPDQMMDNINPADEEPKKAVSVLFTTNRQSDITLFTTSVAARFDDNTKRLYLFVPFVKGIPSILENMSELGIRARSTFINQAFQSLLSPEEKNKSCFDLNKKSCALRFSIDQNSDEQSWDYSSIVLGVEDIVPSSSQSPTSLEQALGLFEPTISSHELELPSEDPIASKPSLGTLLAQSALGRIAGAYMRNKGIEAPYLKTVNGVECLSDIAELRDRSGEDAYVPISRPFDSSLSLLAQRQLLAKPISRILYGGKPRPTLVSKIKERIFPQLQLLAELERRSSVAYTLQNLQSQLESSATFHIFRCVVLESSDQDYSPQGELLSAFCLDLGIEIELFVPPHSEQVFAGDQVIGTEILELDPLQALFIVSM